MTESQLSRIKKVLIANRGEIAVRCIRACSALGVRSVSIYTASDSTSLHVSAADESVALKSDGTPGYLDVENILQICKDREVDAVIPGYGFLSENADFARKIVQAGIAFVGPSAECIADMGLKHRARELAIATGVPVVPGTGLLLSEDEAVEAGHHLGYPIMLKATGGGGGMGLQVCKDADEVREKFKSVKSRGETLFQNSGIFVEKYYPKSRHIEVQVFGNGSEVIHFGERECSIQRRHQKIIEECPSPFVEARRGLREKLTSSATRFARALNYKSVGTVEFLEDDETGDFFFLEMNTRLQVEHGVTELCYSIDLVALMLRQADAELAGKPGISAEELLLLQDFRLNGASIEARVYAEIPSRDFAPSPGILQEVVIPSVTTLRVDTWVRAGQEITTSYDPLIAKVMVFASSRSEAINSMIKLLDSEVSFKGPANNMDFLRDIVASEQFKDGKTTTDFITNNLSYRPCAIDFLFGGAFTTVQDVGRPKKGHGIPKGGPMDIVSARLANILVGNLPEDELLEITLSGPEMLFLSAAVIAVCGAPTTLTIDGKEVSLWKRLVVQRGQRVKVGFINGPGIRAYLAIKGGFPGVPVLFGSKSTTPSQKYGGTQGRQIRTGDYLKLSDKSPLWAEEMVEYSLPLKLIPDYNFEEIYVMQGPHDSADIMTDTDRNMLYSTAWKVGHNSNRTGIKLIGPTPQWARKDGGEAGSHPSNYLDFGYPSPGGVNWGGDASTILCYDSPNFGGLVCSSTVITAELWKLGQLRPDDRVKLTPVSMESATELRKKLDEYLAFVQKIVSDCKETVATNPKLPMNLNPVAINKSVAVLKEVSASGALRPKVVYRQGGDAFILIEFGEQSADISVMSRIRLLVCKLEEQNLNVLLTPHVGCLTIEYDPISISQKDFVNLLHDLETSITASVDMKIKCREFRLPVVLDHPDLDMCIQRYMATTRNKAVYLPDNVEYVRKANALQSRRDALDILTNTTFVVPAVGFISGLPMLFPLAPKAFLAQKYNPTRISTPGGTIGVGGSLLAIYPMDQPGGYMMLARTLEMFDPYGTKPGFTTEKPWIMEPYDLVKFFEVSVEEYDALATAYFAGQYKWQVSDGIFDVRHSYDMFQAAKADPDAIAYKERQLKALNEQGEIEKVIYKQWEAEVAEEPVDEAFVQSMMKDENIATIRSPMAANVWKILVKNGDVLVKDQLVAILEAMKMEINLHAPASTQGKKVKAIIKKPGSSVNADDAIITAE
ncbi:urea carboxylase [Verruconis gallopava]|uniref:Urea carboxylase n=1 Tax=Verruconis gallopava TaxID=253628 RepID=A0A0D2AK35_9PEZI|nr:urea carboxylase [Verruconis gallopava]KIV99328.1 urea carboxylase [Verruconis gallopava]